MEDDLPFDEIELRAHAGDLSSMMAVGLIKLRRQERAEARDWFERAAAQGHPPALTSLGWMAHDEGDDEAAIAILGEAAAKRHPTAMMYLGILELTSPSAWLESLERKAAETPKTTPFEEFEIAVRVESGDRMAWRLQFESGLPGVFGLVNRQDDCWMTRADLVRCALVGLIRAMNRFDRARGFAFTVFSGPWIRQVVSRRLMSSAGAVRTSLEEIIVIGDAQAKLDLDLGVSLAAAAEAHRWWSKAEELGAPNAGLALAWVEDYLPGSE